MEEKANTRIHFIGIGGCGVSALAEIALARGYQISGSDINQSIYTKKLEEKGVKIFYEHKSLNIRRGVDLVVRSSAISKDNVEVKKAKRMKIPVIKHAEFLGILMEEKYSICVAGSHGKTTTDSLIGLILKEAELDPTVEVGGVVNEFSGNYLVGNGRYFVAEACEFDHSFLHLRPNIAVVLNIEEDHPDYYRNMKDLEKAFLEFINLVPDEGYVIVNDDSDSVKKILKRKKTKAKVISFGFHENAEVQIVNERFLEDKNWWQFQLEGLGQGKAKLGVSQAVFESVLPGRHNILNATAALIVSDLLGVETEKAKTVLTSFKGIDRRYEVVDERFGIKVIVDYAHHPSQIRETIKAARRENSNRLVVVFQPHTFSRTKALFKDFGKSFLKADEVFVSKTYVPEGRNEEVLKRYKAKNLVKEIAKYHENVYYSGTLEQTKKKLKEFLNEGDLVLILGAGNIYKIGTEILEREGFFRRR